MNNKEQENKKKGILWILLWCLTFTLSMTAAKFLHKNVSSASLFSMRYIIGGLFFLPLFFRNIKEIPIRVKDFYTLRLHILRAVCMGGASYFTYLAYRNVPIAIATSIGFTVPLIISAIGIIFLKEQLRKQKIVALSLGYLGVLLILRPHDLDFNIYMLYGLLSAFLASIVIISTRILSRYDSAMVLMMFISIFLGGSALIIAFIYGISCSLKDGLLLCLIAMLGTFSQYAYIKAVSYAEASFVAPFEYSRLIIVLPIGYFVFGETIGWWQIAGITSIIIGSYQLSK